jgi:hypothetical protein
VTTYAFIVNYNRLYLPMRMADYLADCGVQPIIVDNGSNYPPLLEYYERCPHVVEHMGMNFGNCVVWTQNLLKDYAIREPYIVTDPDLEIDKIPKDWLSVLQRGLNLYSWAVKAGFSLRIDDLPDTPLGRMVRTKEAVNWHQGLDSTYYSAYIDTTFALYRGPVQDFPAVRTAPPYVARHIPWYWKSPEEIPDDELYYLKTAGCWTDWTRKIIEMWGPR